MNSFAHLGLLWRLSSWSRRSQACQDHPRRSRRERIGVVRPGLPVESLSRPQRGPGGEECSAAELLLIRVLGSSALQAPLPTLRRGRIRRLKFALATLRRSLQASCALQDPCGISTFRSLYMGRVFEAPMGVVSQTPEIRDVRAVRPPCVRLNVRFSVAPDSLIFLLVGRARSPNLSQ